MRNGFMIAQHRFYEFEEFRLDTRERLLLRNGETVPLTPKAFDTLLALVRNAGRTIEKDALMKEIWPNTFVEEATLVQNIFILRRALDENASTNHYIRTVPRHGYRFVREVKELPEERAELLMLQAATPALDNSDATDKAVEATNTLAVMPFYNATNEPDVEWILDGVAEGIIDALSHLPTLRIMARSVVFRYKGKEVDPQEVGREFGVQSVLVGRFAQVDDNLVVNVELVDVANGRRLWSEQYGGHDLSIPAVREEVVRRIAARLMY
jgi:DNA-binding winged helix-turn-helix (wHTH) protein